MPSPSKQGVHRYGHEFSLIDCEDTSILNYPCTGTASTVDASGHGGSGQKPSQLANFYCFSDEIHHEILEISGEEEVSVNIYWPQLPRQRQDAIANYWVRYGKIDVSGGAMSLSAADAQIESIDKVLGSLSKTRSRLISISYKL